MAPDGGRAGPGPGGSPAWGHGGRLAAGGHSFGVRASCAPQANPAARLLHAHGAPPAGAGVAGGGRSPTYRQSEQLSPGVPSARRVGAQAGGRGRVSGLGRGQGARFSGPHPQPQGAPSPPPSPCHGPAGDAGTYCSEGSQVILRFLLQLDLLLQPGSREGASDGGLGGRQGEPGRGPPWGVEGQPKARGKKRDRQAATGGGSVPRAGSRPAQPPGAGGPLFRIPGGLAGGQRPGLLFPIIVKTRARHKG